MDNLQNNVYYRTYSRFDHNKSRREHWPETVGRYIEFHKQRLGDKVIDPIWNMVYSFILDQDVMPAMRQLATAGPALEKDNMAGYNCCYTEVSSIQDFDEILYCLMCGAGVGFSVEKDKISKLPVIPSNLKHVDTTIKVGDSKLGWQYGLRALLTELWEGRIPKWDLSEVRPRGARLMTFGGRASGPEPLNDLFHFIVGVFLSRQGEKLSPLDVHDIVCMIAEIVKCGGVRRSALISLSDLDDQEMREAKTGEWYKHYPWRGRANNSAVYRTRPDVDVYMSEMMSLFESKSGERGIFSLPAVEYKFNLIGREYNDRIGCNPCSEILLNHKQVCNLTEVVARADDTPSSLEMKIVYATFLGTIQSLLTDFGDNISPLWKENAEKERLLGVSITGIMDCPLLHDMADSDELEDFLTHLRKVAEEVNQNWSAEFDINPSAAITCVKPSGTVSSLVNSSSGIHPRFSKYYIRRTEADKSDPLTKFLIDQGVPYEHMGFDPEHHQVVFCWPQKAPEGGLTMDDITVEDQLDLNMLYETYYTHHKVSQTIHYSDDDFPKICSWVWDNLGKNSGIAFFPKDDHIYPQAPYEPIDQETYESLMKKMPTIDWSMLEKYDNGEDHTEVAQTLACQGGACEL